ncbi:MAG: efflux RND transporter permease subunit [Spirochaetia bacterium]|nr:efflux RND transporter permease subunit [Spirochaetia bacterium]
MTLSDISIKNPVLAWMIFIGVLVFGAISYAGMGVSQMPDVDFPQLSINTSWPGASPEAVESTITDTLEQSILGVEGVTEITSSSSRGRSSITVQFDLDRNIDVALQDLQAKLANVARRLPDDVELPTITKRNSDSSPIMWIAVSGDKTQKYIMEYTRDHLKDAFTTIPGVAEIFMGGYREPLFRVWLDPKAMNEKEILADDIVSAINAGHKEVPAGYIDTGVREINIRVPGEAATVEEFASIIIPSRKGSSLWKPFKIGDVAMVEDGLEDIRGFARSNGNPAVGLGVLKQPGTNSVQVAHDIKKKIVQLQKEMPEGLKIEVRFDSTQFVEESSREMNKIIVLSIILTSLVCWLFLGSFGSAVNVFLTIPMSIFGSFFIMKLFGFTLNTFTFLALTLVIGIVVDDAIMMIENITRHREAGENNVKAAIKGAREITFAAIAATVAILAIFVPVIFMKGVIGRYFFQFGVTISVAVLFSLLGALTLTPMYAAEFLPPPHKSGRKPFMERFMESFRKWYKKVLGYCLEHRWQVVTGAVIFFALSMFLAVSVKMEFVPPMDVGVIDINIRTAPGSSITYVNDVMLKVEKVVAARKDVAAYFTNVSSRNSSVSVTLLDAKKRPWDPEKKRPLTQHEITAQLRNSLKAVKGVVNVSIQDMSQSGFTARRGFPVEFTLMGPDWNKLIEMSSMLTAKMEESGLMVDADTDYRPGVNEEVIRPDRVKLFQRGLTIDTVSTAINSLYGGITAGKFTKNGKRYDIKVQLDPSKRMDLKELNNIMVRNNRGELIRLGEVITMEEEPTVNSITRLNRQRAIRISANVAPGKAQGDAMKEVERLTKTLPEGYVTAFTGSSQTFRESFSSLWIVLLLGIFVAYMVLGAQFNSFVHPIAVLMALPFSASGAFIALFLSGKTLNIYSAIGLILLMGIVKKNSILLVDFTNQRREEGMNVKEALLSACPVRLRPIIMTSVATIAAAIPPALATGMGSETRVPMSIVVIGGVIFSTFLTLFVVPCVYSLLSNLESGAHRQEVHQAMKELAGIGEPQKTGRDEKRL